MSRSILTNTTHILNSQYNNQPSKKKTYRRRNQRLSLFVWTVSRHVEQRREDVFRQYFAASSRDESGVPPAFPCAAFLGGCPNRPIISVCVYVCV